jgi:hypothetical protein
MHALVYTFTCHRSPAHAAFYEFSTTPQCFHVGAFIPSACAQSRMPCHGSCMLTSALWRESPVHEHNSPSRVSSRFRLIKKHVFSHLTPGGNDDELVFLIGTMNKLLEIVEAPLNLAIFFF